MVLSFYGERMYWNQKDIPYACCQLLTAINARIFLGADVDFLPSQIDKDPNAQIFESFVDLTKCRYGSCISVYKAWYHLRLHVREGPQSLDWIAAQLHKGMPVGLSCFVPDFGYHSVLCIDIQSDRLRLVNWEKGKEFSDVFLKHIRVPNNMFWKNEAKAFTLKE